ncbi:YjbF family lipoprotein [Grimontia sp. S25]|uniref:YjbF family lipoprotein n=1 Tax=Grimontia sedimenti TaxID=2711294 RepID=A0A6M1R7V0_9GAMM|nr:YjbF family lipoprotein [Grimontia sedimenti]NGN98455.1 YjbF family lipoprotein [Grimontia sedimenti]
MKHPFIFPKLAFLFLAAALSGCSQKYQDVQDTMSLALSGPADIVLPPEQVIDLPYASMYAKVENSAQAFLVLGFAEPTHSKVSALAGVHRLKWLSANHEMLVTERGRIVKTINLLGGNLSASFSSMPDPLALGLLKADTPKIWERQIDWQPGHFSSVTLKSEFKAQGAQTIMVNDSPVETLLFTESVYAVELNQHFENKFWLHPSSGRVIASKQFLAPGLASIDITVLKPFAGELQ